MKNNRKHTLTMTNEPISFIVDGMTAHVKSMRHRKGTLVVTLELDRESCCGIIPRFKKSTKSQNQAIMEYLLDGHSITPLEALEMFGCFRLGARIADLKKLGMKIQNDNPRDPVTGKRYAKYHVAYK